MRVLSIVAAVVLALAIAAWVGYRVVLPRAFVAVGRGAIDSERAVEILRVSTGPSTQDFDGKPVEAGPDHKYVMLDLRINAPAGKAKLDNFQLVREKVSDLGGGENIGDNGDRDYFYWAYLDPTGNPINEVPPMQAPFDTRIAFKVPASATSGYLFYWGYYWGPVQLSPAPSFPDPLPSGYQLGPYVIGKELPPSKMGRVYRALDSRLKAAVAVIVLAVDLRDEMGRLRLMRGARNASRANQPVYDMGEWLGVPYVAVGYSEGMGALVDISAWVSRAAQQ